PLHSGGARELRDSHDDRGAGCGLSETQLVELVPVHGRRNVRDLCHSHWRRGYGLDVLHTLQQHLFEHACAGDGCGSIHRRIWFQHLFWFYSRPAVYIMILPGMGVLSEVIPCFSRNRIFGYEWVAFSSVAIAVIGFLVWGHHMFVSTQSIYAGMVFSLLSYI